jgi:hypothetical protein
MRFLTSPEIKATEKDYFSYHNSFEFSNRMALNENAMWAIYCTYVKDIFAGVAFFLAPIDETEQLPKSSRYCKVVERNAVSLVHSHGIR